MTEYLVQANRPTDAEWHTMHTCTDIITAVAYYQMEIVSAKITEDQTAWRIVQQTELRLTSARY